MDELYGGLVLTFRGLEVGAGIDNRDIHRLAICFAFTIPASMIFCAFSIVIMTVGLLIEDGRVAFRRSPQ
jgi:hypothetical protein